MSDKKIVQFLESYKISGIRELFIPNKPIELTASNLPSYSTKQEHLAALNDEYSQCRLCKLHIGRHNFVYGEGNPDATAMVIGEAPGEQEDLQGRPFVGAAGQLLDKMLLAINIQRQDVYIANIVKCRPPSNRNPEETERQSCLPYLIEQINIIQPKIFLMLGLVAAQTLLEMNLSMKSFREQLLYFMDRPAYVTYHPSALLRNPGWKKDAWVDLQRFKIAYDSLKESEQY